MKTKFTYEKPLTEEIRLTAPVVLQSGSIYYDYNEVFAINYGKWEGEDQE